MSKVIAVTGCPTGIAHTYIAASALEAAAKEMGIEIKVETRGASGIENALSKEDIEAADVIIIASDTDAELSRFDGKRLVVMPLARAIKQAHGVLDEALASNHVYKCASLAQPSGSSQSLGSSQTTSPSSSQTTSSPKALPGIYKHLMNGVSHMLPLVVAGGLIIALCFVFGIKAFEEEGTLASALMKIGGGAAFALMIPILSGFIAYSIAQRLALAPGLVGGMLASQLGAGFLGGIITGFLAGYLVLYLVKIITVPRSLEGLKTILLIPFLSTLILGLLMFYVIGEPIKFIMEGLASWLKGMSSANAAVLGVVLGAMMAFDMGGPLNKTAYTFAIGVLSAGSLEPMAAVMAAGMTPPLGLAIAVFMGRKLYSQEEVEAGKSAGILGLSFITEGAIVFAAADPLRVIPALMIGSASTAAMSMSLGIGLHAPHGGIFVLLIPGAITQPLLYLAVIAAGSVITAFCVNLFKQIGGKK